MHGIPDGLTRILSSPDGGAAGGAKLPALDHADLRVQGLTPADMLGFAIPIRLGSRSRFWNSELSGAGFPATMPGGLDVVLEAGQSQLVLLMALTWLRERLPAPVVSRMEEAAVNHLLPASAQSANQFGWWLLGVLQNANRQPDMLCHPSVIHLLEEELL
ncbi:MAG: hypothetical protein WA970_12795, partial [Gammaproteobacteria bacterium]